MDERSADSSEPLVLGITGASGAFFAVRLMQVLATDSIPVHLAVSPSGAAVIRQELKLDIDPLAPDVQRLLEFIPPWTDDQQASRIRDLVAASDWRKRFVAHAYNDFMTPIASGSFRTRAMVICPCSGSTLSGVARAAASNLIQRAAEVHLKEKRPLVMVPRETPVSTLQLENMHRLSSVGVTMLPAMPGWYHDVQSLDCLINFVVSRILDQIQIRNDLINRWGEPPTKPVQRKAEH